MNTIQSEWEKFSKAVIPSDASEPQVHDMRMSFFSGFSTCLGITLFGVAGLSEDAGVAVLEGLKQEAESFSLQMIREAEDQERNQCR